MEEKVKKKRPSLLKENQDLKARCIDITECKKIEILLQAQIKEQQIILDSSPVLIFYKDKENRFLRVNKALAESMGVKKEDLEGNSIFNFYPKAQAQAYWDDDLEVIKNAKPKLNIIEPMHTPKGTRIVQTDKIPYVDEKGNIKGIIGFASDITELKQAEEILKRDKETLARLVQDQAGNLVRAQIELEKAKRLSDIGTLAATIAHELRNPLAAISLAASNIKRKCADISLERHLQNIEKKVRESDQIINNLLFYSKIKPPHLEKTDLYRLFDQCISNAQKQSAKKILVKKEYEGLSGISVEVDPLQIQEVCQNIVNNAYDAIKESGIIEIKSELDDKFVKISIKDSGEGIKNEDVEKVFDPFFSTKAKGTGLGLSVCKQIVNMHRGKIEIESQEGKGTSVSIALPREKKKIIKISPRNPP